MKRGFLHPVLMVLTVVVVVLVVLWLAQRSLIYFPSSEVPALVELGLSNAEPIRFETEDGLHLDAWFVPAKEPSADRTIVVFNGNAGNRSHRAFLAQAFAAHGLATVLVDYRGYGGNPGLPSERGLERDARAVARWLTTRSDINRSRVVYYGESLGAAVAVGLVRDAPPSALILRSPFSSMTAIGQRHYPFLPVRWFLKDRYPSIDRITGVTCPLLVIAGDADRIVPLDDTTQLFDRAREPKRLVVVPGADHNDEVLATGPEVMRAMVEFLGAR